jgi:hypothetical protein
MPVGKLEERIQNDLRWQRIEDVPEFPAKNFAELRKRVTLGELSLGIDYTVANQLAQWLYGRKYTLGFMALAWFPYLAMALAITLAVALKSFAWLVAVPIVFVGELGSNPHILRSVLKTFFNLALVLSVLVFIGAAIMGSTLTAGLAAFFAAPFLANRIFYNRNKEKLRQVALNSEKVLIYLYQLGKLGVMDSTGKTYWCDQG